ncbi:MAG: cysteine peptidase family C39 domain-containing protein [Peptostreptococcaceae bacterium]
MGKSVKSKFDKLKEWKEEKAPNLEKYLLAGTGAIIGGKALTSILAKMSGMGSVTSAFGMSTPVALASMGIAGAMWGGKKLIEGNLMGEMDVPKRKALLTKTIPSIVGGAGLFSILNRAGASILPFGEVTAPVLAATLGIGFGLYSHKEDLFNKLMGKIKDKKGDKEGIKKMAKNFIWGGLATGLGVGGIKLMGGLTGTSDMLSSMYNSMGMLAPIGLATSAIAMGLLAKNKDINAKFFGMENRNFSFHENMMNYLFGDSGIITKGKKKARDWFTDKQEKVAGWFKDSIAAPFKAALDPVADLTKHTLTNLKNSMVESFKSIPVKIGDTTVSLSEAFNQKILSPLGTFVTGITSKLGGWLGKLVSTPIKWMSNFFQNKAKSVRSKNGGYMSHEEKYRGYGLDMEDSNAKNEQEALWGALDPNKSTSNATAQPTRFTASDGTVLDNADDLKYYEEGIKGESGKGTGGGNIFYSQKDVKGTDSQFMRSEGCGIASAAMCLSMVHKEKITPNDLLPHAKNFRDSKGGVTLSFFESLSNKYEVPVGIYKRSELNVPTLDALLNKGCKIIALVQSGGTSKHYLVLTEVNGNQYTVLDPESKGPKKLSKHAIYGISTHMVVFYSDFKASVKNLNKPDISPDLEERTGNETKVKVKGVNVNDRSKTRAGNQAEKLANSLTDTNIGRTGNKIEAIGVKQTIGLRDDIKLLSNMLRGELGSIKREISYSLNGVSYNLEYIKRLLIENIGDTSNAPDSNLMKNKSFKAAKGRVANFFSKVFGGITDTVIGIKDTISMSVNLFFDDMKAFGKSIINTVTAPFKFIGDKIGGIVKSMLAIPTSIYNGMKNIGSKMLDVTTEFAKQSIGVVGTIVKEGMSLGFDILKGSFRGLVDVGVEATKAVGTLVKSMADGSFFTNVASGMAKLGEQALKGLGYVIGGVGRGIGGIVSGIGNTIKGGGNLFGNIFDSVKNRNNEVYIKGGTIDKVALVDAIGTLGTVDVEHFREVYKKLGESDKAIKQDGIKNHLNSTELNVVNKEQNEGTNAEAKIVEKLDDIAKNTGGTTDDKKPKKEKSSIGQSIISSMGGAGITSAVAAVVPAALTFLASAGGLYAVSKILKKAIFSKEDFIESQGKIMNNILGSNAGETIAENRRPTVVKAGVSTGVKLAGTTVKSGAKTLSTGIEAGHRIGIGAKKAFWDAPKAFLKRKGAKVGAEATEAGLKNLDNVMTDEKVMGGLKKVVDVIGQKFVSLCNKFAPNLSAKIVKFADKFMGKFGKKISDSIAQKGLKASAGVAFRQALGILNSALAVWDAYKGWRDAHIYFGVDEDDCTIGMRMTASLTEFFVNQMSGIPVIGLVIALCVPGDVVANFIYEFFASEDTLKELDAKRKDADLQLSKENEIRIGKGEKPFKSKEEYLQHKRDNKEGWFSKLSKKHEKAVYGETTNTSAGFGSFVSQKDSRFRNLDLSLGGEGATFDKAGCAPSTLMMALKDLGMEFDAKQLTELARGYRHNKDTGVPINYISDVLKSKGVDTRTQVYNGTLDALSNISNGKNIVLTTSENGTPHFVYTKGVDKNGKVILLDPLKQSERRVSSDSPIISSAKMGLRVGGFGDMPQQTEATPQKSYGVMDYIKSILGSTFGDSSMFGSIFGSIFGNEDPTKDNPSYTGTDSKGVKPSSNYVVPEDKMMNVMLDQLKRHEGFRDRPYRCPANKLTIGYGFNMESGLFPKETVQRWMSNGITVGEAEEVLKEEAIRIYNKFMEYEWFQNLSPTRKIAIVNMGFNMGTGGVMKFKNTINKMVSGDWEGAEKGILDSLYARQVPNRAKEIARMIKTGAYGNIKTQMKHDWDRDMNNLKNSVNKGKVRLERIPNNIKNRLTGQLIGGTNDIGREITTSIDKGIQDTVNGLLYPSRTEASINRGGTSDIFAPVNKSKKNRKGTADIFGYGSFGKALLGGLESQAKRSLNNAIGNVTGKVTGTVNRTVRKGTGAITDVVNSPIRAANKVVNQGLRSVDGVVNGVNKGVSKTISTGQKIIADTTKDAMNGIIRGSSNPRELELKGLPKHEIDNLINSEIRGRNNTRKTIEEINHLNAVSKQLNVEKNISRDSIGGVREVVKDNGIDPMMLDKVGDKSVGAIQGMEKSVVAKLDTLITALTKFAEASIRNTTTVVQGGNTQTNYNGGSPQQDEFMGDILRIVGQ